MSCYNTCRLNALSTTAKQTIPVRLEDIRCIKEEQLRPQVEYVLMQKAQSAMQFVMFASFTNQQHNVAKCQINRCS